MTNPSAPRSTRPRIDTVDIARVAVVAALIAVLGLPGSFTLTAGVPITAQTLGIMLAGALLGPLLGSVSVIVVLILVAIGMPLLAGGRGGIGVFVGPSAGYLLGWVIGTIVIGLIVHAGNRKPVLWRTATGIIIGGIVVVYACGIPIQSLITRLPLGETALLSLLFIPGDLVKAVIAVTVIMVLVRAYPRAFRRSWPQREQKTPPTINGHNAGHREQAREHDHTR